MADKGSPRGVLYGIEHVLNRLERVLSWDEAVRLAQFERTGVEPEDGGAYTAEDAARANEIFGMCWRDRGATIE